MTKKRRQCRGGELMADTIDEALEPIKKGNLASDHKPEGLPKRKTGGIKRRCLRKEKITEQRNFENREAVLGEK